MIGLARFQAKEFGKLWSDKLWSQLFMGGEGGGLWTFKNKTAVQKDFL